MQVHTYFNNANSVDFAPKGKPKLLFKACLSHGSGFAEISGFYLGPNDDNTHDVLWTDSDWTEELTALAWVERGSIPRDELSRELLKNYWQSEKNQSEAEEPTFSEIMNSDRAALTPKQVMAILEEVWP
jgi:hypothetical protein